jgi:hypothetical protein
LNRINPLHIIILLIVIIFFIFFQLSGLKSELREAQESYKKSELLAKELLAYKKFYGDKKRIKASLHKILSQRSLQKAALQIEQKKSGMLIRSKAIDLYALNSLLSKIFNGGYPVKVLQIKRVDATHASLKLEITW